MVDLFQLKINRCVFPIQLKRNDNVSISYEPRIIKKYPSTFESKIDNSKYINLKKGEEFEFEGKALNCSYHFVDKNQLYFQIKILEPRNFKKIKLN